MRGTKAKLLRKSAGNMMSGSGTPRQKYRKLKAIYQTLATRRAQKPKSSPERVGQHVISPSFGRRSQEWLDSPAWILKPMKAISRRLRHASILDISGGRVAHVTHVPRVLARHEINTLANGGWIA